MQSGAHSLKGSSGYVGASKIHYACYYIQDAYSSGNYSGMVLYYPLLVEAIIEFQRYSRELIAGIRQKSYEEDESACRTVLANGYYLVYKQRHDKYYCLKGIQDL